MLKQRVATAIVLVALVLVALLVENPILWTGLVCIAIFLGFWEWLRFCEIDKEIYQLGSFALFTLLIVCLLNGFFPIHLMVAITCAVWIMLMLFTITNQFDFFHNLILKLLVGMWILAIAAFLVIELKKLPNGPLWVLCFIAAVAVADIGAYFVGKRFGKTKLAPSVSPGKTVEGLLGGLALVVVVFVPILLYLFETEQAVLLLFTVMITSLVSVAGDLFESKLKRHVDLKDSGNMLPGHGGILDRIDGFLSGAPFFAYGLILLGLLG